MDNIYKEVRTKLNLTQADVARIAGLTRQLVSRTECFMYQSPPPRLTQALVKAQVRVYGGAQIVCTESDLVRGYLDGQTAARKANRDKFELPEYAWQIIYESKTPWLTFRRTINPAAYGFCAVLCFDISMLQFYEKDGTCRSELFTALSEVLDEWHYRKLERLCR